jgi:hypothetical protein
MSVTAFSCALARQTGTAGRRVGFDQSFIEYTGGDSVSGAYQALSRRLFPSITSNQQEWK